MTHTATPRTTAHSPREHKPWLSLALLAASAFCVALSCFAATPSASEAPVAPTLRAAASRCTQAKPAASARADMLLRRARVRWERSAFDAAAAIAALRDGAEAVACLETGTSSEALPEVRAFVAQMRAQVVRDYRRLQLRLRIARDRDDAVAARESAMALRALVGNDDDPYSRWLVSIEHAVVTGSGVP